ncbi:MAG: nuclear transport factor 2 family protein [Dehalococcoidia bacterium]
MPAILDCLADDVKWEAPGTGHGIPWLTPGTGKAHVGAFFGSLGALEFNKLVPINMLAGGNQVCAIIGAGITVKATGKSFEDTEAHLWTFGPDGKVTAFRHLVDTATQLDALRGG